MMKRFIKNLIPALFGILLIACEGDDSGDQVDTGDDFTNSNVVSEIVVSVSQSSAVVSWLVSDGETTWTVEYGEAGFTQGTVRPD